jgi:uncharacterized protein YlxW (UPF0749 family)
VAGLSGLLFAVAAEVGQAPVGSLAAVGRDQADLAYLVSLETERVAELAEQVETLNLEVELLLARIRPVGFVEDVHLVAIEELNIGSIPVTGPGVTVVLDDAPASAALLAGVAPDDLVIHQQDLQAVIAALWAGGAEAMTLMGERVTQTSAFRCTGNVLLLHGQVFSPPFVVQAIGDPEQLERAVRRSAGVQTFLAHAEWVGLGFSLTQDETMNFPGSFNTSNLSFAHLSDDVDPLR